MVALKCVTMISWIWPQVNYFHVEAVDLGTLQKLWVCHDGQGADSAWKLDRVLVRDADAQSRASYVSAYGR